MGAAAATRSATSSDGTWLCFGERTRVHLALMTVQFGYGGYYVLTKAAMTSGFDRFVFAVYRELIGLAILTPLAYFTERPARSAFTVPVCLYISGLGFVGIFLQQTLFLSGLSYTNTGFAAAMQNAIPVFTFLIAVICRYEVIRLNKIDGCAKLMGILICVLGAVIMSLYKGPIVLGSEPSDTGDMTHPTSWLTSRLAVYGVDNWQIGSLCLVLNCFSMGVYTNLQVPTLRMFPSPVSITAGSIFVGTVALIITGIFTVSDASRWVIKQPGNIASVVYAGFVASGLNFTLQTWANQKSGPTLLAAYIPLQTVFSVVLGLIVLDDPLYLGSLIGAILILTGLYLVVWGQRAHRPAQKREDRAVSSAGDIEEPLLS
ncbi:unnamed protein product [Calypogeia fissa]